MIKSHDYFLYLFRIGGKEMNFKEHQRRTAEISVKIGKKLGLNSIDIKKLYVAGLLHDIGKNEIPHSILYKPGKLTLDEMEIMKTHAAKSYSKLIELGLEKEIALSVKYHHERYDGNGYPEGLNCDQIPIFSKIIAVADAYDAMTSERIYRKGIFSKEMAMQELKNNSGKQFDPRIVECFIQIA